MKWIKLKIKNELAVEKKIEIIGDFQNERKSEQNER